MLERESAADGEEDRKGVGRPGEGVKDEDEGYDEDEMGTMLRSVM